MPHAPLFTTLAGAAEQRVTEFNAQDLGNMAWALAKANLLDEKLFTVLARKAEQHVNERVRCPRSQAESTVPTRAFASDPLTAAAAFTFSSQMPPRHYLDV
eukprot:gnl/TRDRNA2_/TRDRNA2_155400_c0_seq2.p1 gnl/TRDRNA2_/TRDRNA2_155400_c0~~gnl/TRDRNA2_/TRDRNA2_155400_c0_seq2.p1  ORF type:complete len:101 (-),score=22.25 gnl/TRDRNA2_/TRDRNA2_155400_c0_seq2:89-391(-)